ncbi:MAG TPA: alanine racemase [Pseudolysinimonas sp.]|jgi:alanine racemase|nr:alanine racemase [Pseudolysinimonas sp.]
MSLREARIELAAVAHNVRVLSDLVAPAQLMAVVKADAYGHGALAVARAATDAGAAWLGVADLAEGLALRDAGIETPTLAWLHATDTDFAAAAAAGIDVGISTLDQLERATAAGATVQLKLDTGLSRNGFAPAEAPEAFRRAAAAGTRVRGIFSHLSNTSRADDDAQLARFERLLTGAQEAGLNPELRHLAATEAAMKRPELRFDLVRTGIGLYGLPAADGIDARRLGLRPVMTLAGTVANVRRVPAGAGVSYGFTHRTDAPTTLALVPLGYADGVPRAASNRAEVMIAGRRYPVVGRIAMDQFLADVGDDHVQIGDEVILWGDGATGAPSAEEWAAWADTINYEIVTRVGARVPRVAM